MRSNMDVTCTKGAIYLPDGRGPEWTINDLPSASPWIVARYWKEVQITGHVYTSMQMTPQVPEYQLAGGSSTPFSSFGLSFLTSIGYKQSHLKGFEWTI
jgi:hypothetical protein